MQKNFSELPLQVEPDLLVKKPKSGDDPKEILELIKRAKSNNSLESEKAKNRLYFLYKDEVEKIAKFYMNAGTAGKGYYNRNKEEIKEDLISSAWCGFYNALRLYDQESGVPFGSYIRMQIKHYCTLEFKKSKLRVFRSNPHIILKFYSWLKENCDQKDEIDLAKASEAIGVSEALLRETITAVSQSYCPTSE
jgi:DNA-directed RNA polymerase specialized sigma subunit